MKKLWQKNYQVDAAVERFTVGRDRELDLLLAPYDVLGSLAHGTMLHEIGVLTDQEWLQLQAELRTLYQRIESGDFVLEEGVEDIHSEIELLLTRKIGDVGKKIHSGRSRNDQVLLDIKLLTRDRLQDIVDDAAELFHLLLGLSDTYQAILLPGYTHLQVAMPSSFGLWFAAYAESLLDDLIQLQAAYKIVNKNPLGSAAGYGSSLPLDRKLTTQLLGFDDLNYNVVYAQMGRGRMERVVAQSLTSFAETLGNMAADLTLYLSQNFDFVSFPDEITTGSSIMPHKKNPDVFEILRGRCNRLKALPNELMMIRANLPSGYHRDLQLTKESFLPALSELQQCLRILIHVLPHIRIREDILEDEKYKNLFTVDAVNRLVADGIPFREAYTIISKQIEEGVFQPPAATQHTHEGSMGNLCNERLQEIEKEIISGFPFEKIRSALDRLLGSSNTVNRNAKAT